jgi:thiamine pyrophosphate-dependent acetolactate synthase large subunit-like protein
LTGDERNIGDVPKLDVTERSRRLRKVDRSASLEMAYSERYAIDSVGGDYTAVAKAVGFHAERIEKPVDVLPAIKRAIEIAAKGQPVFIEFIVQVDIDFSLCT